MAASWPSFRFTMSVSSTFTSAVMIDISAIVIRTVPGWFWTPTIAISPVTPASGPVLLGEDLRDLGAAVAVLVVGAHGGSVGLDGDILSVRLAV